ncbi:uncharacterized protein LOC132631119 [Lycium barbarum]|uniref:uncharacterized protein LOC132631119 n=1 Tax=Lycium barbarum TaxID=112863 RepID=UPI00293F50AD|nr:uncharacterized protein LOC132631119 [Lycium barbarum]
MAQAVGTPLVIDKAMKNQTRPSCARVKVEVDLLKELPKRIHISCFDEETGEVKAKWQKIQNDYLPKYCTQCKLQGSDLQDCWVVHPKYRPKKEEPKPKVEPKGKGANKYGRYNGNNTKMEWNVVTNKKKKQNNMEEGQRALTNEEEENFVEIVAEQRKKKAETSIKSKPWVESSFGTSKDGEKMIQTIVGSNPKGKTGNKEIQEECSMSNEPVSNMDKELVQSKTNTDKKAEILNPDESKGKEITNTQKYVEKENHHEERPSKTVEEEVNKLGATEKEHEKVKVMQDVDLNKVPDKPPDENSPWLVGGEFNVITDEIEKYGGLEMPFVEVEDFNQCINLCQLTDLGFKGSIYTWWNGRSDEHYIFKRLDRCLANQELHELYPNIEVEHLIKQGSDHSPMLLTCKVDSRVIKKSLRFLNFWIEHPAFKDVVKDNWTCYHGSDPFFIFHSKLKKLSKVLSKWSRDTFGDIFRQIDTLEEVVKIHDQEFEENPTGANRAKLQKVQAELITFYAVEEQF